MKPPPFDYRCPESLDEALALLAEHGEEAKVLAGGQSLVPMLNLRALHPALLIDINRLPGLDHVRIEDGELRIGALARHRAVLDSAAVREASPLMAAAYPYVSHGPIRNRGTLCGNLCHNDPASEMPAVALSCDAAMVLRSASRHTQRGRGGLLHRRAEHGGTKRTSCWSRSACRRRRPARARPFTR